MPTQVEPFFSLTQSLSPTLWSKMKYYWIEIIGCIVIKFGMDSHPDFASSATMRLHFSISPTFWFLKTYFSKQFTLLYMKCAVNNHGPQKMNPTDFDDPLTFPSGHIVNSYTMPRYLGFWFRWQFVTYKLIFAKISQNWNIITLIEHFNATTYLHFMLPCVL